MWGVHRAHTHSPATLPLDSRACVPGAHKVPSPHPRGLFWVSQATAMGNTGASWAPCGFAQEPVCEAACSVSMWYLPLGPEDHTVSQPMASGCTHLICVGTRAPCHRWRRTHGETRCCQGPEVSLDLPFNEFCALDLCTL